MQASFTIVFVAVVLHQESNRQSRIKVKKYSKNEQNILENLNKIMNLSGGIMKCFLFFCAGAMEQPDSINIEYEFMMFLMQIPIKFRLMIGHQFSEFIKECTVRQLNCLNER